MTNVYLVTSDDRYFFKSIKNARLYALKYLLAYPDEEMVQIYPERSWDSDSAWGVEMYTQRDVRQLSANKKTYLKKISWKLR